MSADSNMYFLCFCFTTLSDWFENSRQFISQSDAKLKPIVTWSHAFSRAWLRVFALSSDWFVMLFTPVGIGQSDNFGFGFTTLNMKTALCSNLSSCKETLQIVKFKIYFFLFHSYSSTCIIHFVCALSYILIK